jgi:hypothetical protein
MLRLAPPVPEEPLVTTVFTNANFEDFNVDYTMNAGGGAGTTTAITNGNWVFDRRNRDGGQLVMILNKSTYHNEAGSWNLSPEDSYGLGYEGDKFLYICRGSATGSFLVRKAGLYRISFVVGARNMASLKPMYLKLDGNVLRTFTSFNRFSFMRCEFALPHLSAGVHTVTFSDEADSPSSMTTILIDDVKIVPERMSEDAPVMVEIANPGFDEPISNAQNISGDFKPSLAACTGWTVPSESKESFIAGMIPRRWFDGVTGVDKGLLAWPDEMADGFLCAQIYSGMGFSQTVNLPSAGRYRLTFHLAKRCGSCSQDLAVRIVGETV